MTAASFSLAPRVPIPRRNLAIGLAVSFVLHLALLGLHFRSLPAAPPPPVQSLEVVLLNVQAERPQPAETPTALADTAFDGGGQAERGMARSPLPAWPAPTQLPSPPPAGATPNQGSEAPPRELLTQEAPAEAVAERARTELTDPSPAPLEAAADEENDERLQALALAAQATQEYAALSQRLERYHQQPRRHEFAPSTSPWIFAQYVEQWRQTVEAIGNRYYPPQLQGRIHGSLQVTVVLDSDGSLADVWFDTPSIHPELHAAARSILQRAAPFDPFPDAIRQEADQLAITRTWHFGQQQLTMESP